MARRVKIIQILFIFILTVIGLRAFYLQVIKPEQIISQAHKRFEHTIGLSPHRGTIYDRGGQPLAISLGVKSIAANPRLIKNPTWAATKISAILDIDNKNLLKKFRTDKYFVWIKRHATPDEVDAIKALKLPGIGFYNEAKRFYSESDSLANILGFVGIDGEGLEGLELLYDRILKGRERHIEVHKDGLGRIIYARGMPADETKDGNTLWLTIDRRIQYIAFSELKKAVLANNAQSGFVIITNPITGEIYAMTSYPSYNPNLGSNNFMGAHKNRAVVDMFEPGSVIKPLWVSWGLENKYFNPSQSIFCENGKFKFHRITIHDHEEYGQLEVSDIIKFSSNIGIAKLIDPINASTMYSCLKAFGLVTQTGIDFPGEPVGFTRDPHAWTSVDKATISFGQGLSVTGIQLITAFNAMVNGGMVMRPLLVDHITDVTGKEVECYRPTILRKVISQETSNEILRILKGVVSKDGTGGSAAMNSFQVFGKTGTAQKLDPLTGTYSDDEYISSFIGGIIDASGKPKLTMIVSIENPRPHYYASIVACPLFKEIASKSVNILDIRPFITLAKKEVNE